MIFSSSEPGNRLGRPIGPSGELAPTDAEPAAALELSDRETTPPAWTARAGRRGVREKLGASLVGLKHALRGDSSFFAHTYRFVLIALFAAVMGVGPVGWLLLLIGASLIFIAELNHSAVDTLARALGDPEQAGLKVAREIAAAGVLVAVFTGAAIWITVLVLKLGDLLGWWARNIG
jgi:diacylglycerol kinase (ATP)